MSTKFEHLDNGGIITSIIDMSELLMHELEHPTHFKYAFTIHALSLHLESRASFQDICNQNI